jgi:hypothetical protein
MSKKKLPETAPLSDSAQAENGMGAVSQHNSQSQVRRDYADPDYIPPASEPFAQVRYDVSRKDVGDDLFDDSDVGPNSAGKSGGRNGSKPGAKPGAKRRSSNMSLSLKSGLPLTGGVLFGLTTVLIFAGAHYLLSDKSARKRIAYSVRA